MELKECLVLRDFSSSSSAEAMASLQKAKSGMISIVHPLVLKIKQEIAAISPGYLVKDSLQPHSGCIKDLKHEPSKSPVGQKYSQCLEKEVTLKIGTNPLLARRKLCLSHKVLI